MHSSVKAPKTALVADDHELYREGLAQFLKDELCFSKVVEAGSLDEAVALLSTNQDIELALVDLCMPGVNGPQSLQRLRLKCPDLKIAIVAASEAKGDVVAAVASGINGYIPKVLRRKELGAALRTVLAGQIYVPRLILAYESEFIDLASKSKSQSNDPDVPLAKPATLLTPRQLEVLTFIREGQSNPEIARRMGISIRTVKSHVAHLLMLLQVRSRMELALYKLE